MKTKSKLSAYILRSSAGALLFLCAIAALSIANSQDESLDKSPGVTNLGKGKTAPISSSPATPTGPGWSVINQPSAGFLHAVTCVLSSDCWAVGYDGSGTTLAEHWDGASWSIVPSPNPGSGGPWYFDSVTCVSSSDCWAVGPALIEHWDGTLWQIVPFQNPDNNITFDGVTCVSSSDCWAVGVVSPTAQSHFTLIEHWDGSSWEIVPSPPTNGNAVLSSVACVSGSDCWAVGTNSLYVDPTLIEHWDGASWSVFSSPNTMSLQHPLNSVACSSASECWAVGFYDANSTDQTLIVRWDGSSWQIVSSANNTDGANFLFSVTCASASDCWAVGYTDGTPNGPVTLFEHWDGTSWQLVNSPPNAYPWYGVTCASGSECWAVGTQIEEYSPTIPPLIALGSRKVHGGTGTFDINLPITGNAGIECRSPGHTGTTGSDYEIVFTFVNDVSSCGTTDIGSLRSGPNSNQCTVDLTSVPNAQYTTVNLSGVLDSENNTGNVAATMGVLIGDTNGNRAVNAADVAQTKGRLGQSVGATNFRSDVNANGTINSADMAIVKQKNGTSLPP